MEFSKDRYCRRHRSYEEARMQLLWHFSGNIDEELRHVRKVINERPLFLPLGGKAPHPLLLPLGHVKIAVGADGEAGGGVELSVDYNTRLELAARRRGRQVQREDAAGA